MTLKSGLFALVGSLVLASGAGANAIEKGPYLQNPDTTSITICWIADFLSASVVDYGRTRELDQHVSLEPDRRQVWDAGGVAETIVFHQVTIDGLEPETQYYYRVGTDEIVSDVQTFSTAKRPGTPVRFAAFGDTRPTDNHRYVMNRVSMIDPAPDFILHTGDLISNGQRWPDWQGYFDVEGPQIARTPIYPTAGNHEHDADNYYQIFALPNNERWYSFDYGDVHVITLNSNHQYRDSGVQRQWLIRDLRAAYDKPYIFVQFHHPPYTCSNQFSRRASNIDLQREWAPLFAAAEVTAVFNGHDHNYQHNLVDGVHYVVAGGGGASIYDVRPRAFTLKTSPVYHVVQVDAGETQAVFTVLKADDGAVIEQFSVPRRDTTPVQYSPAQ